MSRDNYFRCSICLGIFDQEDEMMVNIRNYKTGAYNCPRGCVEPFIQPDYEPPNHD